jgi:hypothetical protein
VGIHKILHQPSTLNPKWRKTQNAEFVLPQIRHLQKLQKLRGFGGN